MDSVRVRGAGPVFGMVFGHGVVCEHSTVLVVCVRSVSYSYSESFTVRRLASRHSRLGLRLSRLSGEFVHMRE